MNRVDAGGSDGWRARVGAAAAVAMAGLLLLGTPLGDPLIRLSYDLPCLVRGATPEELVLVYINEETKSTLGTPADQPLPLHYHAHLLERLARDRPQLVVYDILLDWPSLGEVRASGIEAALRQGPPAVLVSAQTTWREELYQFEEILEPVPELREAAAGVGLARLPVDPDLAVRRIEPGTELEPSLAWVGAALLNEQVEAAPRAGTRWLQYPGPPEHYRSAKLEQVISEDGLPAGFFEGKIVVVGAGLSAGAGGAERDQFATPWTRWGGAWVPGAAIHATALLNLAHGEWLRRWPSGWEGAFVLLFGLASGLRCLPMRPLRAAVWLGCGALGVALLGVVLTLVAGQWFAWMIPGAIQCPLVFLGALGWTALRDYRDKGILEESLGRHFSPARVRQVLAGPRRLEPGAEKREVSLFMTDIQGFSKITALIPPGDLVGLLNAYYERVIACVHETEGTVMDLVGDSMFALWNAPELQAGYVDRAARSALRLREVLRAFDGEHAELPLKTRMGLHAGTVWVGNIGSANRFDFAAVGEPVNLAARLQALNKPLGTTLLATRDFLEMTTVTVPARLVGHFALRGIDQPVAVHEVLDTASDQGMPGYKAFAQALHDYQRGELNRARDGFQEALRLDPKDGPARFYLGLVERMEGAMLPRDWIGVVKVE